MNQTGLPCQTLDVARGIAWSINSRRRSHIVRKASGWVCEYAAIESPPLEARLTLFGFLDVFIVTLLLRVYDRAERPAQRPLSGFFAGFIPRRLPGTASSRSHRRCRFAVL